MRIENENIVCWKYYKVLDLATSLGVNVIENGRDMLPTHVNFLNQGEFIVDILDDYFSMLNSKKIYYLEMLGNDDLAISMICLRKPVQNTLI